jgi:hypothetical protein
LQITIDEKKLKELFKEAVIEALHERRGLLYEILVEVMNDMEFNQLSTQPGRTSTLTDTSILKVLERNQLKLNLT